MVGAFSFRGVAPEAVQRTLQQTFEETLQWEPSADHKEVSSSPARPSFQVRFFGHFELLSDGEVLALRRIGRALSILKYLLAHRSRPVCQDHLMGWLWPESNLKKARRSLNSAIHSLRKLLDDRLSSASSSASLNYAVLEEGHYQLCPSVQVITDVNEFDERYERGGAEAVPLMREDLEPGLRHCPLFRHPDPLPEGHIRTSYELNTRGAGTTFVGLRFRAPARPRWN